jgi:hypothetical protein
MSWVFSSPRGSCSIALSGATCHWLPHTSQVGDRTTHDHLQAAVQSLPHGARRRTHTELTHTLQERPSAPREPHGPLLFLPRPGRTSPSHSSTPQASRTELFTPIPQSFSARTVRTFPARRPGDSVRSTALGSFLATPHSLKQPESPIG